jgi:hypothetical protein
MSSFLITPSSAAIMTPLLQLGVMPAGAVLNKRMAGSLHVAARAAAAGGVLPFSVTDFFAAFWLQD